jgi:hypothetical protein
MQSSSVGLGVAGVEDFHCAPQQFLEFAPFDSRPSMNENLASTATTVCPPEDGNDLNSSTHPMKKSCWTSGRAKAGKIVSLLKVGQPSEAQRQTL